jgi:hypothetical protein
VPDLPSRLAAARATFARIDANQFASLRATFEAARAEVDVRLARLDQERADLLSRRARLEAALGHLSRPKALDALRTAMRNGTGLPARAPRADGGGPKPKPGRSPRRPAKPGKPRRPGG